MADATIRDAPPELVRYLRLPPHPAIGRYVVVLGKQTFSGIAFDEQGEPREVPGGEYLALAWTCTKEHEVPHRPDSSGPKEHEVFHRLDSSGYLLGSGKEHAPWLPEGWEINLFPTGWTLPHLEKWFTSALSMAGDSERNNNRVDIPPGSDDSPPYFPTPRSFVTHAHLILRYLNVQGR
jgi:hypothetical protein